MAKRGLYANIHAKRMRIKKALVKRCGRLVPKVHRLLLTSNELLKLLRKSN